MIHIHPVDLIAKVENLRIGEQLIYYIGALAEDGNIKPNRRLIKATGIIAWDMHEENIVFLMNRKLKIGGYDYILVKKENIKIPVTIINKARQLQERYTDC